MRRDFYSDQLFLRSAECEEGKKNVKGGVNLESLLFIWSCAACLSVESFGGSFLQYMNLAVGSQIITSTWLDTMKEAERVEGQRKENSKRGQDEGKWDKIDIGILMDAICSAAPILTLASP